MKPVHWATLGSVGTIAVLGVGAAGFWLGHSAQPPVNAAPAVVPLKLSKTEKPVSSPAPSASPSLASHVADCFGTWAYLPNAGSERVAFGMEIASKHATVTFVDYSPRYSGKPKIDNDGSVRVTTADGMMAMIDCDAQTGSSIVLWQKDSYRMKRISGTFQAFALKNGLMGDD